MISIWAYISNVSVTILVPDLAIRGQHDLFIRPSTTAFDDERNLAVNKRVLVKLICPLIQGYNYGINALHWHLEVIVGDLMNRPPGGPVPFQDCYQDVSLTHWLPIVLSKRPYQAKVALGIADKGFCSPKDLYYHGLKFHFLGLDRYGKTPLPEQMQFTQASLNDLTVLKTLLPRLHKRRIVGDKIFASRPIKWATSRSASGNSHPHQVKERPKMARCGWSILIYLHYGAAWRFDPTACWVFL